MPDLGAIFAYSPGARILAVDGEVAVLVDAEPQAEDVLTALLAADSPEALRSLGSGLAPTAPGVAILERRPAGALARAFGTIGLTMGGESVADAEGWRACRQSIMAGRPTTPWLPIWRGVVLADAVLSREVGLEEPPASDGPGIRAGQSEEPGASVSAASPVFGEEEAAAKEPTLISSAPRLDSGPDALEFDPLTDEQSLTSYDHLFGMTQRPPAPARVDGPAPGGSARPESAAPAAAGSNGAAGGVVTVVAARCPLGHLTSAYSPTCRVCGASVLEQQPFEAQRPVLGKLVLSSGGVVPLDRPVIMGRNPSLPSGYEGELPHLVKLPDPGRDISSQHLEVRLYFWHVILRDLRSTNGTQVKPRGGVPFRLRPHDPIVIEPGSVVSLAGVLSFRYEVSA